MTKKYQKRKVGAPKGNQNARKHGYYSQVLTPAQQAALPDMAAVKNLDNEIAVLRTRIKAVMAHTPHNDNLLLRAMSLLTRMQQTQHQLVEQEIKDLLTYYRKYFLDIERSNPTNDEGIVFPG